MHPNGRPLDHAQFKARLSMSNSKHSTISTLTDQALIAFEIEHERNRLREELKRLNAAQDDTERSLEILDYMKSRMDNDPLLNPPNNEHHSTSNHSHNNHHIHSHLPLTLEYLPSSTIIRCANKQPRKISEIRVGDKILSLCINSYPQTTSNGKSRNSYLPKPAKKRPSQTALYNGHHPLSRTKSVTTSIIQPSTPIPNGITPKRNRARARTKPNINIPFMLPPPIQHPLNTRSEAQTPPKMDNVPRRSMPIIYGKGSQSVNLLHQSVTASVNENESVMLSPTRNNKSEKMRSKSFVSPSILYHEDAADTELLESPISSATNHRLSMNSSFTQIPGPLPHTINKINKNRLSYSPANINRSRSLNNSPRHSHQNHKTLPMSTKYKKTRFSSNVNDVKSVSNRRKNANYLESVGVIRVIETKIYQLIEIVTENDFKVRCSPTHLFWICGKGWGCFDPKKRLFMEQQAAIMNKMKKKVRIPPIIHDLQKGEQLLSVGGNKYRISNVNILRKPKGIQVYSIVVNKNDCFFANDLLVKNCIE